MRIGRTRSDWSGYQVSLETGQGGHETGDTAAHVNFWAERFYGRGLLRVQERKVRPGH